MARLSKAPVCFTLAQMRFNPVLDMAVILPALQGAFLKAGYPDYELVKVQGLEFQPAADGFSFNQRAVTRHVFRNKEKTAALLLDPEALTYELTDYPVFEEFSKSFLDALRIVNDFRPIEYCDRLGMRMLDAIQPGGGDSLEQYVVPQALGFVGLVDGGMELKHTSSESLFQSGSRTLLVRTLRSWNIAVPPDLAPLRLKLAPRFLGHEGETIMLDTDSFQTERSDFSVDTATENLLQLKLALSASFKAIVTQHALEVWK